MKNKLIFNIFCGTMVMKMQEQDNALKKQVEAAGGIWEGIQISAFEVTPEVFFRSPITKHILHCPADTCNQEMVKNILDSDSNTHRKIFSRLDISEVIDKLEQAVEGLKKLLGETK